VSYIATFFRLQKNLADYKQLFLMIDLKFKFHTDNPQTGPLYWMSLPTGKGYIKSNFYQVCLVSRRQTNKTYLLTYE
jgi:hypothetical protein